MSEEAVSVPKHVLKEILNRIEQIQKVLKGEKNERQSN